MASKPTSSSARMSSENVSAARATSPRSRPTSSGRRLPSPRRVTRVARRVLGAHSAAEGVAEPRCVARSPVSALSSLATRIAASNACRCTSSSISSGPNGPRGATVATVVEPSSLEAVIASPRSAVRGPGRRAGGPRPRRRPAMPEITAASMHPALSPQSVQSPASTRLSSPDSSTRSRYWSEPGSDCT